ncbi:MAG: carboxypeptidase-like regulatory domain-containing protein [Patescibacteria group bacterium]
MTGKKTIVIVGMVVAIALLGYGYVSLFSKRPLPATQVKTVAECELLGQILNPDDPTTCITKIVATTTATTTPEVTPPPPPPPTDTIQKLNTEVSYTIGEQKKYTNGITVSLTTISDSRCKPGVQCIWAGELAPEFVISGGPFGTTGTTIILGTTRNTTLTKNGFAFTLISATETTAILKISAASSVAKTGIVSGTVTIGPICPVESIDNPCVISPEVYTSRSVVIYGPTDSKRIKSQPLNPDGSYTLTLPTGSYWLQIEPAGIGPGEKKPVTVEANKTSTVEFDIDSGIR